MSKKDEALKLALGELHAGKVGNAMQILREALAEQQQEPVAVPATPYEHRKFVLVGREWYERFAALHDDCQIGAVLTREEQTVRQQGYENGWNDAQRYLRELQQAAPASKPWVGLTDVEIQTIWRNSEHMTVNQVCRAIEAKLREKSA